LVHLLGVAFNAVIECGIARELVLRLGIPPPEGAGERWPWPVSVRSLGRFQVLVQGAPLAFGRKIPVKVLALLKALVAFGGNEVSDDKLIDALWPDEDGDVGHRAYTAALARLRKLLADPRVLVQKGGKLSLNPRLCHVDSWQFEHLAKHSEVDGEAAAALECYRGSFLPDDADLVWTAETRARLRNRFVALLMKTGEALEAAGAHDRARRLYEIGAEREPQIEKLGTARVRDGARVRTRK